MTFKLLKNKNFMLYAFGQSISNLGSIMTSYALSLYVLKLTKSASLFAFVLSIKYLPQICLYPFAGIIVDRFSRKKVLIFFDGLQGSFLLIVTAISLVFGKFNFMSIYSIILMSAISETFYNPASSSVIPQLFNKEDFTAANSFSSWIQNVSLLIGPMLGTFIFSCFSVTAVLICDAVSFYIVIFFTLLLKFNNQCLIIKKHYSSFVDFKDGIKLIFSNRAILFSVLATGASRFFINPFYSIGLPIILIKLMNAPIYSISTVQTFITVGTLASPILVFLLARHYNDTKALMLSRLGKIIPFSVLLLMSLSSFSEFLETHLLLLIILFSSICFLATMFNSSGFIFLNSYFQKHIPQEHLGRFAGNRFMFYSIVEALGINISGFLYGRFNLTLTLLPVILGAILEAVLLKETNKSRS